jgi:hypothetical protein
MRNMDAKRVFDEALPDREALWVAEIQRRVGAYERGEVKALPADQVLAELRALARGEKPRGSPRGAD